MAEDTAPQLPSSVALLLAFTSAVPGRGDEFHHWYDDVHVPQLLQIDGITLAQRFQVLAAAGKPDPPHGSLAVYALEGDPARVLADIEAAAASGALETGDVVAPGFDQVVVRALGEQRPS